MLSFYNQLLHDDANYETILNYKSIFVLMNKCVMTYVITVQFSDAMEN